MSEEIDVNSFESIRPYDDSEMPEALKRLSEEPLFFKMMKWVYPAMRKSEISDMVLASDTVKTFQEEISAPAVKVITQMTTSGLTFSNVENIERNKAYLFISNHRDIVLDSALLNVCLVERGFKATQIAIGNNLLKTKFVEDLVRCNRNFIVHRDTTSRAMIHISARLSNYIRQTITNDQTSIWIAHREGRSKDGDDRTSTALLKMLAISGPDKMEESLQGLNLLPTCVSYEYDPCDIIKTNELLHKRYFGSYNKQPNEDFFSMITGITGHKGRVNISVGEDLSAFIASLSSIQNKNEKFKALSDCIDQQMHRIYQLWPTNYIAYDMLHGSKEFKEHYSNIQRITFANYLRGQVLKLTLNRKKSGLPKENLASNAREILLNMYANPVSNFIAANSSDNFALLKEN